MNERVFDIMFWSMFSLAGSLFLLTPFIAVISPDLISEMSIGPIYLRGELNVSMVGWIWLGVYLYVGCFFAKLHLLPRLRLPRFQSYNFIV